MRLPPLNAVRAFEAAARLENFSRAAAELHVTQGAVSRHVKVLEDFLGTQLFRRHPQGVELTETGRRLLPELTASFDRIGKAIQRVVVDDNEIKVISEPTFAARWLIPHLKRFHEQYPDLRVSTGLYKSNHNEFFEGNFDLGIEQAIANVVRPAELETRLLRQEALTPVCSRRLLEGGPKLTTYNDLESHTLLHPSPDGWDWRKWFSVAGVNPKEAKRGEFFETSEMAIRGAVAGMGITVGDLLLIQDELNAGQLVAPFDLVVSDGTGYFLVTQKGRFDETKIKAFVDWIIQEASADQLDRAL
ncbi:MAG: LysR substrate-binding domain-containing protein [Arenicellales bacterium]|nr:LysR substrate-binding domain-containing protein [Arenicellales bacterium]